MRPMAGVRNQTMILCIPTSPARGLLQVHVLCPGDSASTSPELVL